MRALPLLAVLLLSGLLLEGCAWANRENRPVWNAFEEQVVPDGDTAFYATLPLTIPGGVIAILLDTFIVHPFTVGDDAYEDALDIWHGLHWEDRYYTELVLLPIRVVGTPVAFVFSFLGRSMFDIEPHRTEAEREAFAKERRDDRERALLDWLEELADGGRLAFYGPPPSAWSEALDAAFERALAQAGPRGRLEAYLCAQRMRLAPWRADHELGLGDRDPVVRYLLIDQWPRHTAISPAMRAALLADPNEAVREAARLAWPRAEN